MYVYLIQAGNKKIDPVKVGFSKDPERRVKDLQTGNPKPLRLLMKIKCNDDKHARKLEKTLHEMLGNQNIHLEWFKLKKTHVMKMLTAFANNDEFDQVQHVDELLQYSTVKKPPKNQNTHVRQMELAIKRRKQESAFLYGLIYDKTGICTTDIKFMMNNVIGPRVDVTKVDLSLDTVIT